ncbi:MAG: hypothetical protein ACI9TF_001188, partial [Paracrocinitomix sp.]
PVVNGFADDMDRRVWLQTTRVSESLDGQLVGPEVS